MSKKAIFVLIEQGRHHIFPLMIVCMLTCSTRAHALPASNTNLPVCIGAGCKLMKDGVQVGTAVQNADGTKDYVDTDGRRIGAADGRENNDSGQQNDDQEENKPLALQKNNQGFQKTSSTGNGGYSTSCPGGNCGGAKGNGGYSTSCPGGNCGGAKGSGGYTTSCPGGKCGGGAAGKGGGGAGGGGAGGGLGGLLGGGKGGGIGTALIGGIAGGLIGGAANNKPTPTAIPAPTVALFPSANTGISGPSSSTSPQPAAGKQPTAGGAPASDAAKAKIDPTAAPSKPTAGAQYSTNSSTKVNAGITSF